MKSKIELIAFDLFGVIITEGHMVSNVLMPLLPENTDKRTVKDVYQQYTLGKIEESQFWEQIGQTGNETLRQQFLNSFELDTDIEQTKKKLRPHFQLAILSNLAKDWGETLSTKFGFKKDYSPFVISGEVGCGKPESAIYQHLIEIAGITPEHILFIDDRLENLFTAHHLGIKTVHYKRESDDHHYQADYVIHHLRELLALGLLSSVTD